MFTNKRFIESFTPVLIIIFLIASAFQNLVSAPREILFGESLVYWGYQNEFLRQSLLNFGQIGFWDHINGFGYALLGNQSFQFYPFTWLALLISDPLLSIRYLGMIHLLLGGLSFFYMMRVLKISRVPAFFGSLFFVINPYVINLVTSGLFAEIYNLVWMPLSFAFLWQALFENKKIFAVFSGIALSMQILSMSTLGFAFSAFILICLIVFKFFYALLFEKGKFASLIKDIIVISTLLFGTAFGISAIKLLPILEYKSLSSRNEVVLYGREWSVPQIEYIFQYLKTRLIDLFNPSLLQQFVNYSFLTLIIFSFFTRTKAVVFLTIVSILCLWASVAHRASIDLYAIFYYLFPFLRFNETPARFLIVTNLTLPALAAIGIHFLYKFKFPIYINRVIIGIACVILIAQMVMFARNQLTSFINGYVVSRSIKNESNDFNKDIGNLIKKEKEIVKAASFYLGGENAVFDYTALDNNFRLINPFYHDYLPIYQYFYLSSLPDDEYKRKKYKLLNLMNVKYVVAQNDYDDFPNEYITPLIKRKDGTLYETKNYLSFVTSTPYTMLLIGDNAYKDINGLEAKSLMLHKDFDLRLFTLFTTEKKLNEISIAELKNFDALIISDRKVKLNKNNKIETYKQSGGLVLPLIFSTRTYKDIREIQSSILYNKPAKFLTETEENRFVNLLKALSQKEKQTGTTINSVKTTSETIEISITSTNEPTSIIISDTYYPGWQATLDNKPVSIYLANGLAKGVIVEKNDTHTLTLKYKPLTFKIGATITLFTLYILMLYFYQSLRNKK